MLKNIGIIGNGFVGKAVKESFKKYFDVFIFDLDKRKANVESLKELISKCKMIFLCLPTPMNLDDGSCHLGILENTLEEINDWCDEMEFYGLEQRTIIIKSTIQPGTTEKWNKIYKKIDIAFNPEFLTEANSIEDFKNQNRIIIGSNRKVGAKIKSIYSKVFPKVPIIKTSSTIAEMIKYFTNCFLAMKVSYANEIYQICEKLDIDYDKVVEYAVRDERIGASHLNVPGPDGDFGFGGHCFPKDLNALIHLAEKQGLSLDINVLKAVLETNNKVRTDRDWEQQEGRAVI
jgi:nucleotide sugar dehydrogenase